MKIKVLFIDYQIEKLYDFLLDNLKGESGKNKIHFNYDIETKQKNKTKTTSIYTYITVSGISADHRTMKLDLAHALNTSMGKILRKRFPESVSVTSIYSEKFWSMI